MSRDWLVANLIDYGKKFPAELSITEQFLDFVRHQPRCFQRTLQTGHITGSAWLMDSTYKHVLLTRHRKLGIWIQLGGHADGNEDILSLSHTEAVEESGLSCLELVSDKIFDLDIHRVPAFGAEPEHLHYDVRFIWCATGSKDFSVSEESLSLAWVSLSDIKSYTTEPSMLRMAKKCRGLGV